MKRSLEKNTCVLCSRDEPVPFWSGPDYTYVRCRACGLVYQNPRYSFRHLRSRVYTEKYFRYELLNESNFFRLMSLNLRDSGLVQYADEFGWRHRRFLDIGCATGRLLSHMKAQGWDVSGVELCGESCRYGRKKYGIPLVNKTLEEARFKSGSFETVHLSHVIEHLPDPAGTLVEIGRILIPGGLFLCVTPNVDGFQARLFRSRWRSAHRDHLTLFSTRTLRRMLEEAGFLIVRQFSYGGIAAGLAPGWVKKPVDAAAKAFNCGDVTAFLVRKPVEESGKRNPVRGRAYEGSGASERKAVKSGSSKESVGG